MDISDRIILLTKDVCGGLNEQELNGYASLHAAQQEYESNMYYMLPQLPQLGDGRLS